jgi:hypothetical protein
VRKKKTILFFVVVVLFPGGSIIWLITAGYDLWSKRKKRATKPPIP